MVRTGWGGVGVQTPAETNQKSVKLVLFAAAPQETILKLKKKQMFAKGERLFDFIHRSVSVNSSQRVNIVIPANHIK